MNQYVNAFNYVLLGLLGSILHYLKKRYVDKTTTLTPIGYLKTDFRATVEAVGALILVELNLSILQAGDLISLSELVGAVTAGYVADSGLNRVSA